MKKIYAILSAIIILFSVSCAKENDNTTAESDESYLADINDEEQDLEPEIIEDNEPEPELDVEPEPDDLALIELETEEPGVFNNYGINFKYPEDWRLIDGSQYGDSLIALVMAPADSDFAANFNIAISPDTSLMNATAEEFEASYSGLFDEIEIISVGQTDLYGIPAKKIIYNVTNGGVEIAQTQYLYKVGDIMYVITLTALQSNRESYDPIFKEILLSYKHAAANQ